MQTESSCNYGIISQELFIPMLIVPLATLASWLTN